MPICIYLYVWMSAGTIVVMRMFRHCCCWISFIFLQAFLLTVLGYPLPAFAWPCPASSVFPDAKPGWRLQPSSRCGTLGGGTAPEPSRGTRGESQNTSFLRFVRGGHRVSFHKTGDEVSVEWVRAYHGLATGIVSAARCTHTCSSMCRLAGCASTRSASTLLAERSGTTRSPSRSGAGLSLKTWLYVHYLVSNPISALCYEFSLS